jgi:hypothetical protein
MFGIEGIRVEDQEGELWGYEYVWDLVVSLRLGTAEAAYRKSQR